jgi:hypothetical protein
MNRADFMTDKQKAQMAPSKGDRRSHVPRTHSECSSRTGVARPGKTAKDRALHAAALAS